MEFNVSERSALLVPVEKPEPQPEPPEPPRGEYGEPWEVGEATTDGGRSCAGIIVNGTKQAVECKSAMPLDEHLCGGALADRIIACVNACEGIDDETLRRCAEGELELTDNPKGQSVAVLKWSQGRPS